MRITSKGQVTIPVHIRDQAGLRPNTEVEFVWEDGKVVLKPLDGLTRGQRMVARLKGAGTANLDMSSDELFEMMRGPWEDLPDQSTSVNEKPRGFDHK